MMRIFVSHFQFKVCGEIDIHEMFLQISKDSLFVNCDMIKRNESDVGDIVFKTLAKTVFKFLCFILFLAPTNSS